MKTNKAEKDITALKERHNRTKRLNWSSFKGAPYRNPDMSK